MSTYTEPLVMLDLHARNVDQAHRDIIQECLAILPHSVTRGELIESATRLEAETPRAEDYSEVLGWLADDAEAAVNDHTPYVAGTIAESGTWYVAPAQWWEGVDA